MNIHIRKSTVDDLNFLVKLEEDAFGTYQRSSVKSLKRSLKSKFQEVYIAEKKSTQKEKIGALVLFIYPKSLRIYSIAILQNFRGKGYGDYLMNFALKLANRQQYEKVLIEVNAADIKLLDWYKVRGFQVADTITNYYGDGKDAIRLVLKTNLALYTEKTNNLIVINQPFKWDFGHINAKVISVKEYINNPTYQTNADFRVFNLCSSYNYQSYGYYVSLLASARGQRIIPNLIAIRDFKLMNVIHSVAFEIDELMDKLLKNKVENNFSLNVYFGHTSVKGFASLAMKLYQLFEVPLFSVDFIRTKKWAIKKIKVLTLSKLSNEEMNEVYAFAKRYFDKKRFRNTKLTSYKYDIAILINPNEHTPPSGAEALQKFKMAANRKGLYIEFITKKDIDKINEFDALFIRETTSVNDHTYEFSRMAYAEGLVVIDDPWSILRCSNKIFQNEIFQKHKLLTPETTIFTKNFFHRKVLSNMKYPLVLKQPDSAFSLGVKKVENEEEAFDALNNLFKTSDMVVCQEFLYSDFDWRIGIIDNKPIYACKYYMSKNHWQIYNWKEGEVDYYGKTETLSIDSVPEIVLRTALKAAMLIGDGLYGVDLKMIDGKVYVIEVNDNPNIDVGYEDQVLKDKLYELIIDVIYKRIEAAKNVQKIDIR